MGSWLLLIELGATSGPPAQAEAAAAAPAPAQGPTEAAAAAVATAAGGITEGLLLPLGPVLQGYVDCAYSNMAQPPAAPLPQAAGGAGTSARTSGGGTPIRRMASREKVDSSSSTSPTPGAKKRSPAAGAPAAVAEDGSTVLAAGEGKAAVEAADAGAVLKGHCHAVSLIDDPSTAVFRHLLALLHSLQVQLLVLAASMASQSSPAGQEDSTAASLSSEGKLQLPHASNCQVLALANTWLAQHAAPAGADAGAAAAVATGGKGQYEHQSLLPAPAIALEALKETGMDTLPAVQQLVELCAKALRQDCVSYATTMMQQQRQKAAAAGEASSSATSTSSSDAASVDTVRVYRLVLDAVCLQQACGAAVSEEALTALALAARFSTRVHVQQLLQQRGSELLQALLKYVQQEPEQEEAEDTITAADGEGAASSNSSSSGGAAASTAQGAALREMTLARRCVVCATVFMEICSSGRRGVGEWMAHVLVVVHVFALGLVLGLMGAGDCSCLHGKCCSDCICVLAH